MPGRSSEFEAIVASLKRASAALRDGDVPFALAGSLATWARGGPQTIHDLDFIVRPGDAERALQALVDAGMRPERPPEAWLVKAWDGEVLIDLIFCPNGLPDVDALLERSDELSVEAVDLRVMALEDVFVTKLNSLTEHHLDYANLLEIARSVREQVDWRDVRSRTSHSAYAKAFFTLVEELAVVPAAGSAAAPPTRPRGQGEPRIRVATS
jgi:Uncharacterised nucleotidyltransferase